MLKNNLKKVVMKKFTFTKLIIYTVISIAYSTSLFSSFGATPGILDTTFNTVGYVTTNITPVSATACAARAVVVDGSGNFVVAGTDGVDFAVARYLPSGLLDTVANGGTGFGTGATALGYITTNMGGTSIAYAVALQNDGSGNIIAAGTNGTFFVIARYTSAGLLDTTFGTNGTTITQIGASTTCTIYGVVIDTNHKIVVAGTDGTHVVVARYTTAGALDTSTFNSGGSQPGVVASTIGTTAVAYAVTIDSNGKIVVAGSTTTTTQTSILVARYLSTGVLDTVANGGSGFGTGAPAQGWIISNISSVSNIAYGVVINSVSGKILVCGRSGTAAAPNFTVAQYVANGSALDTANFGSPNGYNRVGISTRSIAWGITLDSSQRAVVSGQSGTTLALSQFAVARYTTTGAFDTTFNTTGFNQTLIGTAPDIGYDIAINSSGNIAVVGSSVVSGAVTDFTIAEYFGAGGTPGALNTTNFGTGNQGYTQTSFTVPGAAMACAIQPDRKIVTVGSSGTAPAIALARYTINGVLDATFGTGGIVSGTLAGGTTTTASVAYAVAIQPNNYIVVAGAAATSGTTPNNFVVARYTPTGVLDTTFGTNGYVVTTTINTTSIAYGVAVDTSGNIIVCGQSGTSLITPTFTIARYTSAGALDTTFNTVGYRTTAISTYSIAFGVTIDNSGKIVVCGQSGTALASPVFTVARYTSAGALDTTNFNSPNGYATTSIGTTSIGYNVAVNSSGTIVVAGESTTGGTSSFAVAEYTSAGVLNSGSFGTGGSPAGTVVTTIGTTSIGYALALQFNGKIIVGGISAGNIAVARYTTAGILDTTFNSPTGYVVSTLSSGTETGSMGLFLQPNGRIVTCATTSSDNGDFATIRYLGDAAPQGCVDVTYQTNGYYPYQGQGSTAANFPEVTGVQVQSDNTVLVLSKNVATTVDSKVIKLNADGSTELANIIIAQAGGADIIQDSQQRVLSVGKSATPHGWVMRATTITNALAPDATFGGATGVVTGTAYSTSFKRVGQQSTGQIIVIGQGTTATTGIVVAYNQLGALNTTNFNGVTGFYSLVSENFNDMLIDTTSANRDKIYVAMSGTGATNILIMRLTANGLLDSTWGPVGNAGFVDTGLAVASYGAPTIAFDTSENIILAAPSTSGNIVVQQYPNTATTNTPTISGTIAQTTTALATPVITQLQCDTNNRPVFVGYDNPNFFLGRALISGGTTYVLDNPINGDTTSPFAPYSYCTGLLRTAYDDVNPTTAATPPRAAFAVSIGADGNMVFGGYEAITAATTSVSLVAKVVGDSTPYGQTVRYAQQTVGGFDTSLGTNGNLSLASTVSTGIVEALYTYTSGTFAGNILAAIYNTAANNTQLVMFNSSTYNTVNTAFGSGTGSITLNGSGAGLINPSFILVSAAGNIYISGQNYNSSPTTYSLMKINSTGSAVLWTVTMPSGITLGRDIRQQASGRIISTGTNATGGVIIGFNPNNGAIDPYFGGNTTFAGSAVTATAGYYQTNVASIADIATFNTSTWDDILLTYKSASATAPVICLVQNAFQAESASVFTFGTALTVVAAATNPIRMAVDANGNVVVVSYKSNTGFLAHSYTSTGANNVGPVTISLTNSTTALLSNILTTSDGATVILGSDTNGNQIVVARLNSSLALDTTFNTTGIFQAADTFYGTTYMTQFNDIAVASTALGDINNDFIIGGANGSTVPYLVGIYNNTTLTAVNQSTPAVAAPGTVDFSLNDDTANGYISLFTDLGSTLSNNVLMEVVVSSGNYYIAADSGTNIKIIYMNGHTDSPIGTFGSNPVTLAKTGLMSLFFDGTGTLNVCGGSGASGSGAGWLARYNGTTGALISGFPTTTNLDVSNVVDMQTTGRIIVAGERNGVGTLVAYNSVTGTIDTSFGQGGGGYYSTGVASAINDMTIGSDNSIYIVYSDISNNTITQKISANGVTSGNPIWTGTSIANGTSANNFLVLDNLGNVIVSTYVTTPTAQITLQKYTSAGTLSTTLNITNTTSGFTLPSIMALITDANNNILFCGNNNASSVYTSYVARVTSTLSGLDATFNPSGAVQGIQSTAPSIAPTGSVRAWNDITINLEGRIAATGYALISGNNTPYLTRYFGTPFIAENSRALTQGTAGTIDTLFGTNGEILLASLAGAGALAGLTPQVVAPDSNGNYYIAFTSGALIRLTNGAILDTTLAPLNTGFLSSTPAGIYSMFLDGSNRLIATGTTGGAGWLKRYLTNSSSLDTTFNSNITSAFTTSTLATVALQQTMSRYIVAGQNSAGHGALFAFTNSGILDVTFNSNGTALTGGGGITPGIFDTGVSQPIYGFVADQYDRLLIAYRNGTGIDLVRLTSAGQLDTTFGSNGTITAAIPTNADSSTQIHLALDASGNIVIAAHVTVSGTPKIAVKAYANGSGTVIAATEFDISGLTSPTLTSLVTTTDGKVLVAGYQSSSNQMWVARIVNSAGAYGLDTTFAPSASIPGIMQFQFDTAGTVTARALNSIAIYGDGEIAMVGTETDTATSPNINPFLAMAYNTPYIAVPIAQDSKPIGTNDITLGASSTSATNLGVTFFGNSTGTAAAGQVARAVALENNANIVVALDGGTIGSPTPSNIFINLFNIDGTLNTTFNTTGQQTITQIYQNQFVRDMITYTTVSGVNKAILVGYVTNTTLSITDSLVLKYNLTTAAIDTTFGGYDGNPAGVAFGDAKQAFVVGRQSTGRVIVGGLNQAGAGLLLGYTSNGKLDYSFGTNGYFTQGTTGIYTHAIDTSNRIVVAYNDGSNNVNLARILADGSGLDTSFNSTGIVTSAITGISGNTNMKVVVDGSGNVYVAAVTSAGANIVINKYTSSGSLTTSLTITSTNLGGLTGFTIGRLLVDSNGKIIVAAYTTAKTIFIRTTTALAFPDSTFNPSGTPGYLSYAVAAASPQVVADALIHPDGRIIAVGSE